MQLLISVAGPAEARAALRGGADVIDAKDPWRGALGPVSVQRLAAIRAAVAGARPLSAAVGDATSEDAVAGSVAAALSVGVAFVKLGLAGVTGEAQLDERDTDRQRRGYRSGDCVLARGVPHGGAEAARAGHPRPARPHAPHGP